MRAADKKGMSLRRREAATGLAFAALPLCGFLAFYVIPFIISITMTFTSGYGGQFVGLQNYSQVIGSVAFQRAVWNTTRFIAVGVPSIMVVSLGLALLLQQGLKGTAFFRSVYILPLVLAVASVIQVFQIVFEQNGILNAMLTSMGFDPVNFLHSGHAFGVLVTLYVWKNAGYNIILFLAGLSAIPDTYYDAAKVDGAGEWRRLRSITLPLLMPTFLFVFIISIINAFKAFREAFVLGGAYPDESIYMLQHYMNNNFQNLNYPRLSVAALLTFIVIFVLVFLLFHFRNKAGD
ncbi:sn-glycerol-3-phosphate transport system permease protein ugpA [uncultured Clostridium sp.]|nr:sn-glycerol-3-phosphate transport system permease protein ugpA [uncultured Clostridium sp.]